MAHALVNRVTVTDPDEAMRSAREEVAPRVAQLPGFVSAQWMIGDDGTGMSVMVFETREAAEALAGRLRSGEAPTPAGLRFDGHDVVEVFLAI